MAAINFHQYFNLGLFYNYQGVGAMKLNRKEYLRQYWIIKNQIGYAVISEDATKRKELEAELKQLQLNQNQKEWVL